MKIKDIYLLKEKLRFLKNFDIPILYNIMIKCGTSSIGIDMFALNYWDSYFSYYYKYLWNNDKISVSTLRRLFDVLYMIHIEPYTNENESKNIKRILETFKSGSNLLEIKQKYGFSEKETFEMLQNIKNIEEFNMFFQKK